MNYIPLFGPDLQTLPVVCNMGATGELLQVQGSLPEGCYNEGSVSSLAELNYLCRRPNKTSREIFSTLPVTLS